MTKRKNKRKGVRAKKARSRIVKPPKKARAVPNPVQPVRVTDRNSQSQSESPDAEGGTPGSAPSILEEAMRLGADAPDVTEDVYL